MSKLIRDPQLNDLVRQLNEDDDEPRRSSERLEQLLGQMTERGASDLLLTAGSPPVFRVEGNLNPAGEPLSGSDLHDLFAAVLSARTRSRLTDEGASDFSLRLAGHRFRINVHRQRGTLAAAIRALPDEIPTLQQLNLPPSLVELIKPTRGLVLVCGPTGAGKTTTLAALIGEINRSDARHIITIEDPVEYEHRNQRSIIEQIEVGGDTPSFSAALRSSLRQDPDVILVGEMRDLETIGTALTAAETGHLILSTLHTSDVVHAIHRIVDVFPPAQQPQIRQQLSLALNAIVVQHLIPLARGKGRAVAVEVLLANNAIRNHIRNGNLQHLATELTLGKRAGMIALEDSLNALVQRGLISAEEAKARVPYPQG